MSSERKTNWVGWHDPYADPTSPLSARLDVVRRHVRTFLDRCAVSEPRALSLCAGDGRDLVDVLARHRRGPDVRAHLVELDPELADRARARAAREGLGGVTVTRGDAAVTDLYVDAVPAELVLLCGVFGNIGDADVRRTVETLPQLCATGGTVIWTRHRRDPDLTPQIRRWFASAGFREEAFDSPGPNRWSVGAHSFLGDQEPLAHGGRLFTFVR